MEANRSRRRSLSPGFGSTCDVLGTLIRRKQRVSQPVFARFLNSSESTVEKWETGAKKASGMALKLPDIVEKHGLKMLA